MPEVQPQVHSDDEVIHQSVSVEFTADERAANEWAEQTYREGPSIVRDTLKQLVTLSTALLAGAVGFLKDMPIWPKSGVIVCLTVSLFFGMMGLYPFESNWSLDDMPGVYREARNRSQRFRLKCIFWSCAVLLSAVPIVIVGLALQ